MDNHEIFMGRALELATYGWGRTNPNPLVGAVIVKDNKIIAEGYHKAYGLAHAEVEAINNATESVEGATLYVNLEPCSHFGKTPPCVNAIINAKIKNVVLSLEDPNPIVSGNGIKALKEAGINVTVGILQNEAEKLNEIYIKYITKKRPFVIMKSAMTLDGKTASVSGDSKWISGEGSRKHVHKLRDRVSAIMAGINTVLLDNPYLTARLPDKEAKNPVRIIVDSKGKLPLDSNVLSKDSNIILAVADIDREKEKQLEMLGVKILKSGNNDGRVDLNILMDELYKLNIDSVLLEGGGTLNASALKEGIVDKVIMFIAPKIIGGETAKTPVEGEGISFINDAIKLKEITTYKIDDDIVIEGYI